MKENIETKDVQRTEYLDKNGLDMLWAKVKENVHNQVEVERNRATTQESRIIDTKADKSELHSSYVSNSTFTALEQKVTANTAAISNKQDAGNYIPYELYNNESYGEFYKIPKNIAFQDDDSSNGYITMIEPMGIFVYRNRDKSKVQISSTSIRFDIENGGYMYLGKGLIQSSSDKFDLDFFQLDKNGITLRHGTNDEVLTSAGSTINITRYALKSELPTVPTKVSELQNDSNFTTESYVTQNFAYKNTVNNTIENLQQSISRLDSDKQNKITPGNLNISALNSQNTIVALKNTIMDLIDTLEKSGVITVTRS